jgi:hypothetical protein
MKPSAFRIERMLAKVEAALLPPERPWLRVIIDRDDEVAVARKKEEAVAEHLAPHPVSQRCSKCFRPQMGVGTERRLPCCLAELQCANSTSSRRSSV